MNLKPTLKPENIKLNAYLDLHRMDNVEGNLPECPKTLWNCDMLFQLMSRVGIMTE